MKTFIADFDELTKFCKELRQLLSDRAILLIQGDLGAGKTKTVEFLMKEIGIHTVSSPTFALHNQYTTTLFTVDHFDLYRLSDESELETSGFWDALEKNLGWVIVEWPEKISIQALPRDWPIFHLKISIHADKNISARQFELQKVHE